MNCTPQMAKQLRGSHLMQREWPLLGLAKQMRKGRSSDRSFRGSPAHGPSRYHPFLDAASATHSTQSTSAPLPPPGMLYLHLGEGAEPTQDLCSCSRKPTAPCWWWGNSLPQAAPGKGCSASAGFAKGDLPRRPAAPAKPALGWAIPLWPRATV